MSTITPHYRSVQHLLQSQSFSIDEYQREYKSEKENIDELLADLRDKFRSCYRDGDETKKVGSYEDYFLGSIIVSKRNGKNYLVDGQQRVTSLTLLLIYLHRAAKAKGLGVVDRISPLIYSDNYGEPTFNLDIPERLPVSPRSNRRSYCGSRSSPLYGSSRSGLDAARHGLMCDAVGSGGRSTPVTAHRPPHTPISPSRNRPWPSRARRTSSRSVGLATADRSARHWAAVRGRNHVAAARRRRPLSR